MIDSVSLALWSVMSTPMFFVFSFATTGIAGEKGKCVGLDVNGIFAHGTPKEILTVDMLAEVFGVKADIFVNSQGISVLSPVSLVEEEDAHD